MPEKTKTKVTTAHSYLKLIDEMIQSIQFGSVTVIIQDGKVIQIDKTEKRRLKN